MLLTNATNCLPAEMVTTSGAHAAQSDGGDIRFSSDAAGASQLACEIVLFTQNATPSSAVVEIWVPVNILTGADVTIYIWYSAGGGLTQPAANASFGSQAVWDSNEVARLHMGPLTNIPDSTANGNTLNAGNGGSSTDSASQVGNATIFAAGFSYAQRATTTGLPSGTGTRTLTLWFKKNGSGSTGFIGGWGDGNGTGTRFDIQLPGNNTLVCEGRISTCSIPWTEDLNWHQVVFTLPSGSTTSSILGYLDGASKTVTADGGVWNTTNANLTIARPEDFNGSYFVGRVDEVGVSNIARSATWIAATYANQNSPGAFTIAGSAGPVASGSLFRVGTATGIGSGGKFFQNPLN